METILPHHTDEHLTANLAPGQPRGWQERAKVLLTVPAEHRGLVAQLGTFLGNTGGGLPSHNLAEAARILRANDWVRPDHYKVNYDPRPLFERF